MRTIRRHGSFRRDFRREGKGRYRESIASDLAAIIQRLATDSPLEERHRDHALTGSWVDHRDCHVKPDLVLIYRKPDQNLLELVRLASHAELGW